jgi:UPF0271 protein
VRVVIEPFGDAAWRARLPDEGSRRAVLAALRALPRVVDAVVSEQRALVTFAPGSPPEGVAEAIERALGRAGEGGADVAPPREHTVHVRYDGADLAELAYAAGVSPDEAAALHAGAVYEVAFVGFQPGFAYLRGLDSRLVVPRRASPRPRVPALSVAVAGPYTGVYPFASPGGWSLLGTAVGFAPFDAERGALLAVGDRVRFEREPPP